MDTEINFVVVLGSTVASDCIGETTMDLVVLSLRVWYLDIRNQKIPRFIAS